jgi:arylformamidase
MKQYDISLMITTDMPVWPGDPSVELQQISSISAGEMANVSRIALGVHCGTHIDAPKHFLTDGNTVDQIPLDKLIGEALVVRIDDAVDVITEEVLKSHPEHQLLTQASKVLFRTKNSNLWHKKPIKFDQNYVGVDASGASYLTSFNLDLVGIDYLSIAPYNATQIPHKILLAHETIVLEGLDLSKVPGGFYELYCLPLKIFASDGAPARAILIER